MPECDREASIIRRPWPIRGSCAMGKGWVGGEVGCIKIQVEHHEEHCALRI